MITLMIFVGVVGSGGVKIKEVLQKNMLPYVLLCKGETHSFLFIIFIVFGKIFSD